MTQSILLPSNETFITPSLTLDTDVVFTVFTLTFSGMLDFEFSVLFYFHIYAGDSKYVAETVFTNTPLDFG